MILHWRFVQIAYADIKYSNERDNLNAHIQLMNSLSFT